MYGYEHRDKSAPMDLDPQDTQDRLASLAVSFEDGPARKRPHSDLSPRPFHPNTHKSLQFGTNTPFLFHLANPPPMPESKRLMYNPNDWANVNFGLPTHSAPGSGSGSGSGNRSGNEHGQGQVEDVDMSDSPAKPSHQASNSPKIPSNAAKNTRSISQADREPLQPISLNGKANEEKVESTDVRPIAQGAVVRERKKRQQRRRGRQGSESEGETSGQVSRYSDRGNFPNEPLKSEHQHHYNFHVPTPAMRHSEIPALLLGYLQFFVNASVVVFVIYLAVQFVLAVRRDVKDRMQEVSGDILQEIAECSHLYLTNRCDPNLRVPAMDAPCKAWEACMKRDPTMVGRTNVMAETFAGVINSFVDPISWKTMSFTLVTLTFLIILTNSALFNLRSRASPDPIPTQASHQLSPYPHPQFPVPGSGHHNTSGAGTNVGGYGMSGESATAGAGQIGWSNEGKKKGRFW